DLVHASQPARVELAEPDGVGLEELLEDDAVLTVFAGSYFDRCDRARDGGVAQDVVEARQLLHPIGIDRDELLQVRDCLFYIPDLVCIHHQATVRPNLLAHDARPAQVVLDLLADLQLQVGPAASDSLATQRPQLLIRIAEPTGRRRVSGKA